MTFDEVYRALEAAGSEQTRKIYLRHGAAEPLFGVQFKTLNALKKKIKTDQALALALWETGNSDAQTLALMIADPKAVSFKQLNQWLKTITYYQHSNYLGGLTAKTSFALNAVRQWSRSRKELVKHCGYDVLATLLKNGHALDKEEATLFLETIATDIHKAPNRARNAMNNTLIAIGVYCQGMKTAAIRIARQIGPVDVDHGDTSCKTPDAEQYIEKAYAHRKKKASRR